MYCEEILFIPPRTARWNDLKYHNTFASLPNITKAVFCTILGFYLSIVAFSILKNNGIDRIFT